MTIDALGNIYVADGASGFADTHGLVRKISTTGSVTTVAGSASWGGTLGSGIVDPTKLFGISSITASPDGNLYTIDPWTYIVQKITPNGSVTTFAGARNQAGSFDGPATAARFKGNGIAADQQGSLFIADTGNHTIRKIDLSGNVTTYAGLAGVIGGADGVLQSARFKEPSVLKFDSSGKLFVGDKNGIRVISNGSVSTPISFQQLMQDICGVGVIQSADGLDIAGDGRIAVAYANCRRVGIYQNNLLSVVMGSTTVVDDVDGSPSTSRFYFPSGVAFLPNGDLLITDSGYVGAGNNNIKRYSTVTNSVSLFAGQRNYINPVDGAGSAAKLDNVRCPYKSATGDIWFTGFNSLSGQSVVRRSDSAGNVTSFALSPPSDACVLKVNTDGTFISAGSSDLRLYSQAGVLLQTLATMAGASFAGPLYSAVNGSGDIFFSDTNGFIRKYSGGAITVFSNTAVAPGGGVSGIAIASTGEIIAAGVCTVSKVSTAGAVIPIAASGCGAQDGPIADAKFLFIAGLAVGANDAIYVADSFNGVIRRILNGNVDTVAGTPWLLETKVGPGAGSIYAPRGIAYDALSNSLIITTPNTLLRAPL